MNDVPPLDLGMAVIQYVTCSPGGFAVRTRSCLRRRTSGSALAGGHAIRAQRDNERRAYRVGSGFVPLVGVRDVEQVDDTLVVDVQPVTFPTYAAINHPAQPATWLAIANPAATALIILAHGGRELLVQQRSPRNRFYPATPGASAAGYLDGTLDRARERRGQLLPIDTTTVIGNALREAEEELGLGASDLHDVRLLGLAQDRVKVHTEFLLLATTALSAADIIRAAPEKTAATAADQGQDQPDAGQRDFEEQLLAIDASLDALELLLTQVRCPLPPTHAAAFAVAGFALAADVSGERAARAWLDDVAAGIRANYRAIDELAARFLQPAADPAAVVRGYDPAYTPHAQGLPTLLAEFERVGLRRV